MANQPFNEPKPLPEPEEPTEPLTYRDPMDVPARARDRKIHSAMLWLRGQLASGPRPASELEDLARAQGIPHTTLEHAKKRIFAHSERRGNRYFWYLPAHKKQALTS